MAKTIKIDELGGAISKILDDVGDITRAKADKALRATLIKVWGDIITDTPVGNPDIWKSAAARAYAKKTGYKGGTARGNWFIGDAPTDKMHGLRKANKGASYVRNNTPVKLFGKKLFLFNNMPYIERLEFGSHSTQSPTGMVRKNVINFPSILRRAFKQV